MPAADVTIIIPQHEQAELTVACVHSLCAAHEHCGPVIVVDDGSSTAALAAVWTDLPHVSLVAQSHRGVTAAWNRGADAATTTYLVFLNNDTITELAWIDDLVRPLRVGQALLAGTQLRRESRLPRNVLARLPSTTFLDGWCFAMAKRDWTRHGGFDERFRLYFSDTDFQARLMRDSGRGLEAIWHAPHLPLRHLGHRSTRRLAERSAIWQADRRRFVEKWSSGRSES